MTALTNGKLRILIADDNNTDRLILNRIVRNEGHQTYLARDGVEAISLYRQVLPDLVLLDALMPNMDGFEAARNIKKLALDTLVPVIFLTSLNEAESLSECLEAGGDDFLSKPYNKIILKAKIAAFERMIRLHALVMSARDEISRHNDHLMLEQEVAKTVFDNIAHTGCLEASNIKYLLSPVAVFNGDILLASPRPGGNLLVFLGDFTGHGLPAAIGAMPASEIFYGMSQKGFPLQDILKEINSKLKKVLPVGVFCCGCMAEINFRDELVEIWNGGLPDVLIYRASSLSAETIKSNYLPLGILSDSRFNSTPDVYPFYRSDRLYLWSDGIHEEEDELGEMFGNNGLMNVFEKNQRPEKLFDELRQAVIDFTSTEEQADDHSIIEICQVECETIIGNDVASLPQSYEPVEWSFNYELKADSLKSTNPVPLLMHIILEVPGLKPYSSQIYTILSELFSNALEHGVMGLNSSLKENPSGFTQYYQERTKRLEELDEGFIRFMLDHKSDDSGGVLSIEVEDSGDGFDYESVEINTLAQKSEDEYCGRGLPLIENLCETFSLLENGNHVRADFRWNA